MTKNKILLSLLIIICLVISSCNASKNLIQIKFSDLDSAIRTVIPSHHCGCTWKDEKTNIYAANMFKHHNFSAQSILVKSMDRINITEDSPRIYEQLKKLDKRYASFGRFFIEYRTRDLSDTTKFNIVGTWFHFTRYCEGYVAGIDAYTFIKNTGLNDDRKKLCK